MLENRKQVIEDWEFLTRRKLTQDQIEQFANRKEFGLLATRTREERLAAGELVKEATEDYFLFNLKLEKWLAQIYELPTDTSNANQSVWMSPGSKTFHTDRDCEWFKKGKVNQANYYARPEYKDIFIDRNEAEEKYLLKPCKYCCRSNKKN